MILRALIKTENKESVHLQFGRPDIIVRTYVLSITWQEAGEDRKNLPRPQLGIIWV